MDEAPAAFFDSRGYTLSFAFEVGVVWAELREHESGQIVPRFGKGHDQASAATRAVARWREEQD